MLNAKALDRVNLKLAASQCRLRVVVRGKSLYLRGSLPDRKTGTVKQQWISLGMVACTEALQPAMAKALTIEAALESGTFDWAQLKRPILLKDLPFHKVVAALEKDYFDRRQDIPRTRLTWSKQFMAYYRKLPQDRPLTEAIALEAVTRLGSGTPSRIKCATAMQYALRFADIEYQPRRFNDLCRESKKHTPAPRDIPSDEEIEAMWARLKPGKTRYCFGIYAAFGIRPSEILHADVQSLIDGHDYITIGTGAKTGKSRRAYALPSRWIDLFELRCANPFVYDPTRPNTYQMNYMREAFRTQKLGPAYNLRHAFKIRSLKACLDPLLIARSMGHSAKVALEDYARWLSARDVEMMFKKASDDISD
ncbi:MAG: hypothetical protein EA367_19610 [Leptolyngbya sp. DLM2.Bin15]|nr:MAG: hypothetical protein EA367_19610 [Leptolyngbya sp. DLM2.Bin15]